ncbi:hypothetical protein E2C01_064335 [Portunus trituberculatus]|uniref:Uncharacterized protein n=1 Tax=Portunus trituberculatus TaxID=210409 RepID=A0A5B7HLH9_PORTR|nr:hypothetical protein [Portunus trituberculatus]
MSDLPTILEARYFHMQPNIEVRKKCGKENPLESIGFISSWSKHSFTANYGFVGMIETKTNMYCRVCTDNKDHDRNEHGGSSIKVSVTGTSMAAHQQWKLKVGKSFGRGVWRNVNSAALMPSLSTVDPQMGREAAVVQWNHACFVVRGVSKRMGSNPVLGLSVGWASSLGATVS